MSMFDGLGSGIGINREQPVLDEGGKAFAASTAGYSACRLLSRSHAESAESRDRGGAGRFRRQAAATLDAVLVASAFRRKLRTCNTDERRMLWFSWLPPSGGSSVPATPTIRSRTAKLVRVLGDRQSVRRFHPRVACSP